jgi:8-oxo-dGTP pyrophosphatase MutT (NUDIX family)
MKKVCSGFRHTETVTPELWELYDEDRGKTGEVLRRGEVVTEGRYYVTVVVWMENSRGELLLQLSAKYGLWGTTGGHPKYDEDSVTGAVTEIREELGVEVDKVRLVLIKTLRTEDDFVDIYYLKIDVDLSAVRLQDTEVKDVRWASVQEVETMIGDGLFLPAHAEFFMCFKRFKF